jgi:hypothetical protein
MSICVEGQALKIHEHNCWFYDSQLLNEPEELP